MMSPVSIILWSSAEREWLVQCTLSACARPSLGESAGPQARSRDRCSRRSSPPLSAVWTFAREFAKRSRPSSVPHRPETIYWRVEDPKIGCGRRTRGGKAGVTGGIQYYYRSTGCRSPLNVDNHACALLGLGVPTIPWFLECSRIYREIAFEFKRR